MPYPRPLAGRGNIAIAATALCVGLLAGRQRLAAGPRCARPRAVRSISSCRPRRSARLARLRPCGAPALGGRVAARDHARRARGRRHRGGGGRAPGACPLAGRRRRCGARPAHRRGARAAGAGGWQGAGASLTYGRDDATRADAARGARAHLRDRPLEHAARAPHGTHGARSAGGDRRRPARGEARRRHARGRAQRCLRAARAPPARDRRRACGQRARERADGSRAGRGHGTQGAARARGAARLAHRTRQPLALLAPRRGARSPAGAPRPR